MKVKNNIPDKPKENLNIYEKRFFMMMKLYRIHKMLKAAKIQHVTEK